MWCGYLPRAGIVGSNIFVRKLEISFELMFSAYFLLKNDLFYGFPSFSELSVMKK